MRKNRFWILLVVSALVLIACRANYLKADQEKKRAVETNESVESVKTNTKIYLLKDGQEGFVPQIVLNESDHTFQFSYDVMSSYLAVGTYTKDHGQLELKTDDGKYYYIFDIADDHTLKFDQGNSSDIKMIMGEGIQDGAEFICGISEVPMMEKHTVSALGQKESVSSDIEMCIREKLAAFEEECELTDLWYDKVKSDRIIDSYMKYGNGSVNGVKRENVVVIMSDLKTGENTWSLEPNTIYTDWNWILIRDDENSEWVVDDYGNE